MATNAEVIQLVQSGYSHGVQSDDSRLSNRHIYRELRNARNTVITQQARKKQKISDWNYIVLPCVELIEVPSHECPCLPEAGCSVYRTKYPLPKPLTDLDDHLIQWVLSVENSTKINIITREQYLYNAGNKYTSKNLKGVFESGHIFFYGVHVPEAVKIKFLPEDPEEAYAYPSMCPCTDCDPCMSLLDKDFPIDGDMLGTVIDIAVDKLKNWFSRNIEDQTNNTADTPAPQAK